MDGQDFALYVVKVKRLVCRRRHYDCGSIGMVSGLKRRWRVEVFTYLFYTIISGDHGVIVYAVHSYKLRRKNYLIDRDPTQSLCRRHLAARRRCTVPEVEVESTLYP